MSSRNLTRYCLLLLPLLGLVSLPAAADEPDAPFKVTNTFKVGGEGGWDYLTIDPTTQHLFVSRATHTMVLNATDGSVIADIAPTPGVHGIALVPDLHRGFISDGTEGTLTVFDTQTFKILGTVKAGQKPDAIIYDPASKKIFAFNGKSRDATAVDAAVDLTAGQPAGQQIPLDGKPEFAASDGQGHVYVNLEDKSEIAQIDSKTLKVTAVWPIAPAEEASGLAIDAAHHLLFAVAGNKMMAIVNTDSGKVVATPSIGGHPDAAGFDPGLGLAFSSNGVGTLTIVKELSPDKFEVIQNLKTRSGARTLAVDPVAHRIYLATARYGPATAPSDEVPHPRPKIIPDSFIILVVQR